MTQRTRNMELLAPAGGEEQLRAAVAFGADAVYLAAEEFGMRAHAKNFSLENIAAACACAHKAGARVHVACNIMMTQADLSTLPAFLERIDAAGADALIIGDLGAFSLAQQYAPHCELHVSTQASVANSEACKMWYELGAKRIVCAREMTLSDIAQMRAAIPDDLELEVFVHGAQCMAVSGRCLISSFLAKRSGNRGDCTQPCRWHYVLEEEKRPGEYFPIEEDRRGSYLMNAYDLNMLAHLDRLRDAGVDAIKIEGRNKKAFYVATVVNAYRQVLDGAPLEMFASELACVSHRPYGTGFFFGEPQQADNYDGYEQEALHVADVLACQEASVTATKEWLLTLRCRNRIAEGEQVEVLSPYEPIRSLTICGLEHIGSLDSWSDDTVSDALGAVAVANRTSDAYMVRSPFPVNEGSLLRVRVYRRSARHESADAADATRSADAAHATNAVDVTDSGDTAGVNAASDTSSIRRTRDYRD